MTAKRGYLWRLSDRKILSKSDWKRKFFLLCDDKLYYYDSEGGCGGEAGNVDSCYLIHLILVQAACMCCHGTKCPLLTFFLLLFFLSFAKFTFLPEGVIVGF